MKAKELNLRQRFTGVIGDLYQCVGKTDTHVICKEWDEMEGQPFRFSLDAEVIPVVIVPLDVAKSAVELATDGCYENGCGFTEEGCKKCLVGKDCCRLKIVEWNRNEQIVPGETA